MSQRDYVEKDYYKSLGVPKDAAKADITKAYRKLARELHPDARPDDPRAEERFKEVGEAHSVLSNPEKRAEYDRVRELVGSGAFRGGFAGGAGGGFPGGGVGGAQGVNIEDLLGNLFGGGGASGGSPFGGGRRGGRSGPTRGRDVETDLTLSFDDAMAGVTTTLRVSGRASCSTCRGTGSAPGTAPITCPVCQGRGQTLSDQGPFSFAEPCVACGGSGRQITNPCPTCSGSGTEVRSREIRARIPDGVSDGARIRLKGKGEAGTGGGPAGDLFVRVHVTPHPLFGRRGDNLTLRVPITFGEAALGTKLKVPILDDGPVTLRVPAGTESGRTFRVRGRGAPRSGGAKGDLLVTVDIDIPTKLTRTQRKILVDFEATLDPEELRAHLHTDEG